MKAYVVVDVEMCKVQKSYRWKNYRYASEIIQIGAVMMNEEYEMIGEFSTYVCPKYGKIDYFIRNLTGITEKDVRTAPSLEDALRSLLLWMGKKDVTFFSWSETDYYQIRGEILSKGLDEEEMSLFLDKDRWVDYQKTVNERFELGRALSLRDALELSELDQEGRLHDGLVDAYNTARMIAKLERNPDYRFVLDRLCVEEQESQPLCTSLGSLLQGLNLEVA